MYRACRAKREEKVRGRKSKKVMRCIIFLFSFIQDLIFVFKFSLPMFRCFFYVQVCEYDEGFTAVKVKSQVDAEGRIRTNKKSTTYLHLCM